MIKFEKHILKNGLTIIAHYDKNTPIAAFNMLYNVGSKDENPEHTGLAHLFEHLMFEGSANVKEFDSELQSAGGENNAFTNNDITNYYITLPVKNIETAFYLESDRMFQPAFSEEKLVTQKNVVIEEFKQSYLNQPYGDVMLLLRPLCYKVHPYQWSTIGKSIDHVAKTEMNHVKDFFNKYYKPDNAILSVAGNISCDEVFRLAEKWFGDIEPSGITKEKLPVEPPQKEKRFLKVDRDVPYDEIYMAFHMPGREHNDYPAVDLISDILGNGHSSRLYRQLLKNKKLFSSINAYVTGSLEPGLLMLYGRLNKGVAIDVADRELNNIVGGLLKNKPTENELQKVKNKVEVANSYADINVLPKAMNLAYYEYLGDADKVNHQTQRYFDVSSEDILRLSKQLLHTDNLSVMHYCSNQKNNTENDK